MSVLDEPPEGVKIPTRKDADELLEKLQKCFSGDSYLILSFEADALGVVGHIVCATTKFGEERGRNFAHSISHLIDLDIICDHCFGLHDHTEGGTKKGH